MLELFIKSNVDETTCQNEIVFRVLIWALERIERPDVRSLLIEAATLLASDD
jgi:hypothetical protein